MKRVSIDFTFESRDQVRYDIHFTLVGNGWNVRCVEGGLKPNLKPVEYFFATINSPRVEDATDYLHYYTGGR